MNQALSPLDGRYASSVDALRPYFSEEALMRARIEVELKYLIALSREPKIRQLRSISPRKEKELLRIVERFSDRDAAAIRAIEKKTRHDVKAMEYFLREKIARVSGLKPAASFLHFGLTSEDVNNLAYGLLIMRAIKGVLLPELQGAIRDLLSMGRKYKSYDLLSLTHGQPATPTTLGKEMMVFVERLGYQWDQLKGFNMKAKFGGAVGMYSAHRAAYPEVAWENFGRKFMKSLGFRFPLRYTTQINSHDDIAELSHILFRWNTIGIDLCRDVWSYISRGVFRQKVVAGEVGSSTMPHKVNPIDFENAEGNFGVSNALFSHFAEKLPISRLQRDLSDSTVQRNIGVAVGHHLLAVRYLRKGLTKLQADRGVLKAELDAHPELIAEAVQTVLRKHGVEDAYEQLKKLTRGERVTKAQLRAFIGGLTIPKEERKRLTDML